MANVGPHLILAERTFQVGSGLQFTVRAYKDKGRTLIRFAVDKAEYQPSYFYDTFTGTTSSDRKPRERGRRLRLHGGNPAWDIDGETMDRPTRSAQLHASPTMMTRAFPFKGAMASAKKTPPAER